MLERIDAAFEDVQRNHSAAVPCRAGCSPCCYALFAVPVIDGFLLLEGIQQAGILQQIETVCQALFDDFARSVCHDAAIPFRVEMTGWKEFEAMAETFQRPCPFLTPRGLCGVYRWRPRICRLAGTVFTDPATGIELPDFCPMAAAAREHTGFSSAPLDLMGLDMAQMEYDDALRHTLNSRIPPGHTFPAAGLLEAIAVYRETHRRHPGR